MIHYYLAEPSRPRKKRDYSSKIDPFKPYIDTILEDDPSFNREVLLRNLRKQKYTGGVTILRDYAAKWGLSLEGITFTLGMGFIVGAGYYLWLKKRYIHV